MWRFSRWAGADRRSLLIGSCTAQERRVGSPRQDLGTGESQAVFAARRRSPASVQSSNPLLALKVSINGAEPILCGAEDLSVLTAGVNLAGQLGTQTQHPRPGEPPDSWVRAGGLTSRPEGHVDEHINWIWQGGLQVGDVVTIEVVHTDQPSIPISRKPVKDRAELAAEADGPP